MIEKEIEKISNVMNIIVNIKSILYPSILNPIGFASILKHQYNVIVSKLLYTHIRKWMHTVEMTKTT